MIGYIYHIVNKENGKMYIGKAIDIRRRIQQHFSELRKGSHHSTKLQRAFNKYGENSFTVEYFEKEVSNEKELYLLECEEIKKYNSFLNGYNETLGGEGHSTVFDFSTAVLLYQIGKKYEGIIHKIANYYNCDRTTIKGIFNNQLYEKIEYKEEDVQNLLQKIGIDDSNLKENYKDNYSKQISKEDIFYIFAILEFNKEHQKTCAEIFNVKPWVINDIARGLTYKKENQKYKELSLEERKKLNDEAFKKFNVKSVYAKRRRNTKNPLTQEQIDYILDNKEKTNVQLSKELGISTDRVSGIKNKKYYLDLIENYEERHS